MPVEVTMKSEIIGETGRKRGTKKDKIDKTLQGFVTSSVYKLGISH